MKTKENVAKILIRKKIIDKKGNGPQLIMYVGMDCTTPTPNPTQCIIYKRKRRNMTLDQFHIIFDIPKHGS